MVELNSPLAGVGEANWPTWPQFGVEEAEAVSRVITSNQLFADREVALFERQYADFIGTKFALGLGNATQGLHLALAALRVGAGDEVIVTPYSWISSASCVLMQNAVPVFCDIEAESLGLDPILIEKSITKNTRAIIAVHMWGYPSRITDMAELARERGLALIEDASHAHGAAVDGRMVGSFGDVSVFSLHQRKALSVGDGGVLCTDNEELYESVRRLRSFGDEELSYNYRMTEFAGALGQVGLRKLVEQNEMRRANAKLLSSLLSNHPSLRVRMPRSHEYGVFYAVVLDILHPIDDLDSRLEVLQSRGLPIRKTWSPLHRHPHFNTSRPPRGNPWELPSYSGSEGRNPYREKPLPVVEALCPNGLLELYVHPPAGEREMRLAASLLWEIF